MPDQNPRPGWDRNDPQEWHPEARGALFEPRHGPASSAHHVGPPLASDPTYPGVRRERRRMRTLLRVIGVIAVLVVLLIVAAIACAPTTAPSNSGAGLPAPTAPAIPAGGDNTGAVDPAAWGTPVARDGLTLTVTEPETGDGTFGKTYCSTVSYVNSGDETVPFNLFDWKSTNADGVETSASFSGGRDVNSGLGSGTLNKGGKRSGEVCFDGKDGRPVTVTYSGSLFGEPISWGAAA